MSEDYVNVPKTKTETKVWSNKVHLLFDSSWECKHIRGVISVLESPKAWIIRTIIKSLPYERHNSQYAHNKEKKKLTILEPVVDIIHVCAASGSEL
jgi:hypothetical protein